MTEYGAQVKWFWQEKSLSTVLTPVTVTLSTFPAANCLGLNPVPRREKPARPTTGAPLCLKGVLAERREQDRGTKGIKRGGGGKGWSCERNFSWNSTGFSASKDKLSKYNINCNIRFVGLDVLQWGSRLFTPRTPFYSVKSTLALFYVLRTRGLNDRSYGAIS